MIHSGIEIQLGDPRGMGRRFVSAWNGALVSEKINERHVMFVSREDMLAAQLLEFPESSPE